jgi:ATP-dependent DNA helicase RecG
LLVEQHDRSIPTTGAILLFGRKPNRFLPQAGITAVAYPGSEKDYSARERATLRGPIVPLLTEDGQTLDHGVIDQAMEFVRRNTEVKAWIDQDGRQQERWDYPSDTVRETLVNAVAHRDYTITVTDIELSIYAALNRVLRHLLRRGATRRGMQRGRQGATVLGLRSRGPNQCTEPTFWRTP